MENIGVQIGLGFVKTAIFAYDAITLPIYFIAQQPWKTWNKPPGVWAKPLKVGDPSSPLVRVSKENNLGLENISTIDELFRSSIARHGNKRCFGTREVLGMDEEVQKDGKIFKKLILGDYKWFNYKELDQKITMIGKGLLSLGIRPHQNIAILADTRVEWMLTAQACFRMNVTVVTLYSTLGEEGIIHGINETEVTHIVTSQELVPKLKKILPNMPSVTHIIYMENPTSVEMHDFPASVNLVPFTKLEKIGMTADPELRGEKPTADDLAIIMYTSGSTGKPKGVMITHKNILTTTKGFVSAFPLIRDDDVFIAFLPLAHVLELSAECFFIACGVPVGYSSPHTMTDQSTAIKKGCKGDATVLKPTIIAAVPLILDRIRKSVTEVVESQGKFSKAFFNFALKYKKFWEKRGFKTPILDRLLFKKIRKLIGGKLRALACGGAPLSPETHEFISTCFGSTVLQGYGLTETTAGATVMDVEDNIPGRVGAPLSSCYIKLVNWEEGNYHVTDKPNPRGEIVVGGDCVSSGYYKNEAMTKEYYREEDGIRWFYTGDIGEVHPDGAIKIIDRKKDLLKLQFGEYISLGKVETELKTCPLIDNICVYGNSFQNYLVALIVPNKRQLRTLAKELRKQELSFNELCQDFTVISAVEKSIKEYGVKCRLQKFEIPTKVKLCKEEWHPDTGLVTAAFKLRRNVIQQFYQRYIDEMYGNEINGQSKST